MIRQWCFVLCGLIVLCSGQNVTENEIRPYEFTFNIVDFQHRSEKKDDDGLITGEYGFITADGIYHETAYATDKTGDFIITKMRHRKITSLKDAQEIFKDKPEQAQMLTDALMKSCVGCEIELDRQESSSFVKAVETTTVNIPKKPELRLEKKLDLAMKEMMKVLNKKAEDSQTAEDNPKLSNDTIIRDMVVAAKKFVDDDEAELEKMANELFYRFNYTITSHAHWEDGFRDGRKDGEYNAKFKEGVDTHVKYTSNEFGHQPNITLVPSKPELKDEEPKVEKRIGVEEAAPTTTTSTTTTTKPYRGYYFNWFRK